jgi:hypothetical protein
MRVVRREGVGGMESSRFAMCIDGVHRASSGRVSLTTCHDGRTLPLHSSKRLPSTWEWSGLPRYAHWRIPFGSVTTVNSPSATASSRA